MCLDCGWFGEWIDCVWGDHGFSFSLFVFLLLLLLFGIDGNLHSEIDLPVCGGEFLVYLLLFVE